MSKLAAPIVLGCDCVSRQAAPPVAPGEVRVAVTVDDLPRDGPDRQDP